MTTRNVQAGLTGFIQAFSAVDAVGSRRRREKLLDERLEDERAFRAQQVEFQQSAEDRAQTEFDETREAKERRRAGDAIGLDPASTNAQLREAAQWSAVAQQKLLERQSRAEGTAALGAIGDAQLAARQVAGSVDGARGEDTEQLSGLSTQVGAAQLPGDIAATRKISKAEIARQRGEGGPTLLPNAVEAVSGLPGLHVDMPADFLTGAEITEFGRTNPDEAAAIRRRQKAELLEVDPRDGTATPDFRAAKAAGAELRWVEALDANNVAGDQQRQLIKENPTAATAQYFEARNSLTPETRRATDKMMKPAVEQSMAEQRMILDAPDADPTSQDSRRARTAYSRALAVDHAIVTGYDPAKEVGIRATGIPSGNEELGEDFKGQLETGPRTDGMISDNKQRQATSQLIRDYANPTKKASPQQLKNLYIAVQAKLITPEQATWASWHGGQLPGAMPEHIVVPKGSTLIAKDSRGNFRLIHSGAVTDRQMNEMSPSSRIALKTHFDQFNTADDDKRGARYQSAFMEFLGRTRNVASSQGIDLSSDIDLVQLAARFHAVSMFKREYDENFWEFGPDFFGKRDDYAEHFDEFDASVYGTKVDDFLAAKHKTILDEFSHINVNPIQGGGIDAAGYRQALKFDNPPAYAELNRRVPSDTDLAALMLEEAQRQQLEQ